MQWEMALWDFSASLLLENVFSVCTGTHWDDSMYRTLCDKFKLLIENVSVFGTHWDGIAMCFCVWNTLGWYCMCFCVWNTLGWYCHSWESLNENLAAEER